MNKSDAERLATLFSNCGFKETKKENEADILVVVACSVRQTAVDRIWGAVTNWRKLQKTRPGIMTVLTGCVLPRDRQKAEKKFDMVFNIEKMEELRRVLNCRDAINRVSTITTKEDAPRRVSTTTPSSFPLKPVCAGRKGETDYFSLTPEYGNKFSALVPIMTGCNNFCAYCAVPYVRGRERSRSVKEILSEIKKLAQKGCLEITLLGQNVNSFSPADKKSFSRVNPYKKPFPALLWEVNRINGVERVFFTASHPKDMSDELIDALKLPKMVNYLHLPLQSGDDEVLKKMNRRYTAADYLKLIKKIRIARPDIAIGTDIIVGFPGETKRQFQNTLKVYREADFDICYHAKYSPRPGTAAAQMKDSISLAEKKRRWRELQNLMEKIILKKNQKYLGKTVSVLVDKFDGGRCEGNSREMKRVEFKGSKNLLGKIVDVKIDKAMAWILRGKSV